MKKSKPIIIILLISTILNACNKSDNHANTTDIIESSETAIIQETSSAQEDGTQENITVDAQSQIKISNMNNHTGYLIQDGWLYGLGWDSDGNGSFQKMRIDGSDKTILKSQFEPYGITIHGEYIYAIIVGDKEEDTGIYRMRFGGNDIKLLVKSACDDFQIYDKKLYYTKINVNDNSHYYYSSDLEGNEETLILEKNVYTPFIINDILFFQDDAAGERIKQYNLHTKEETTLTNSYSYGNIVDGIYLYYIKNDNSVSTGDKDGALCKIELKSKDETILYEGAGVEVLGIVGDNIYFVNVYDDRRLYSINKDGNNIKQISQDNYVDGLYLSDDKIIYMDRDSEHGLENVYMCNLDGSNKFSLADYNAWSDYKRETK